MTCTFSMLSSVFRSPTEALPQTYNSRELRDMANPQLVVELLDLIGTFETILVKCALGRPLDRFGPVLTLEDIDKW